MLKELYKKALALEDLTHKEGVALYNNAPTGDLMFIAHQIRKILVPGENVTWIIDRNVNITNVCISRCKFCNFHVVQGNPNAYITTIEEYKVKIEELFALGGKQLLLQGGLHPKLGLQFYTTLFRELKTLYPELKLHALGPPEIVHLSKMERLSYADVLKSLIRAGLDSLPGAGAEILCDSVRKQVSPGKAGSDEWLNVMREAHKLNMVTTATMMFGHIEKKQDRIEHLIKLREVQYEKPEYSTGFLAFIPWPFQDEGTMLKTRYGIKNNVSAEAYIRLIAMSRIMLPNIPNIQASWLTIGKETGQLSLHAGANDFGSIMMEENVVSSAGAKNRMNADDIQNAIREAGFKPQLRNQKYEYIN